METTLATILITATATVAVIGLGVTVWAIAQLKRKVSHLEGLCSGYEHGFRDFREEMQDVRRDFREEMQDIRRTVNDAEKRFTTNLESCSNSLERKTDDFAREISKNLDSVHYRIDRDRENDERMLDKRFDAVYRKFYTLNESKKQEHAETAD